MRAALVVLALSLLLAPPASAGPWPRAPGTGFLSFTSGAEDLPRWRRTYDEFMPVFADLYGEYGLTKRLVLGAQLRRTRDRLRGDLLLRWHPTPDGPVALGITLGARLHHPGGRRPDPLIALHVGRGGDTALGNIWARADLRAVRNHAGLRGIAELEMSTQVGLRTDWGGLAMLTLSDHHMREARTVKLSPAVGYTVTRQISMVLGATLLPRARQLDGVHLSLWFER